MNASAPCSLLALLTDKDADARRMSAAMRRFHARTREAIDAKRADREGQRVVVTLTRHRDKWTVGHWNADDRSVRFDLCADHQEARAKFAAV